MVKLFKVEGSSMAPLFVAGDYVLLRHCKQVNEGDVVAYQHAHYGRVLKRVTGKLGDCFYLSSDNPVGISQYDIGLCHSDGLRGKLLWHFKPS